jgi:hypothetical protein
MSPTGVLLELGRIDMLTCVSLDTFELEEAYLVVLNFSSKPVLHPEMTTIFNRELLK